MVRVRSEPLQASGSTGADGWRRTISHVTTPAPAQTSAPSATVHGTPTAWDSNPDSIPPTGIMPPNTSAQMPMTRPRIASETPIWMSVLVVAK